MLAIALQTDANDRTLTLRACYTLSKLSLERVRMDHLHSESALSIFLCSTIYGSKQACLTHHEQ